jgi:hypothetical protein
MTWASLSFSTLQSTGDVEDVKAVLQEGKRT